MLCDVPIAMVGLSSPATRSRRWGWWTSPATGRVWPIISTWLTAFLSLGWGVNLQSGPIVTCENFNELGSQYQQAVNNAGLVGLPAGITANFNWHWQLMWSPGVNPPNSTATNNVEPGWTPASPAITF